MGLLDDDIFMFGEDIDWCWRIKETGYKVFYVPESVVYHYHGASSRQRRVGAAIDLHQGMAVFYRKHMAEQHGPVFNAGVNAAIWFRCGVFVVLRGLQSLFSSPEPGHIVISKNVAPRSE